MPSAALKIEKQTSNRADVDPVGWMQNTVDECLNLLQDMADGEIIIQHVSGDLWEQLVNDLDRAQQSIRFIRESKAEGDQRAERYVGPKVL